VRHAVRRAVLQDRLYFHVDLFVAIVAIGTNFTIGIVAITPMIATFRMIATIPTIAAIATISRIATSANIATDTRSRSRDPDGHHMGANSRKTS
jgi:hypothetical protein